MAIRTKHFDSNEREELLAVVKCETNYGTSIYVYIPALEESRRTDGGARDTTLNSVDFEGDIEDYSKNEYVYLIFEPSEYGEDHILQSVEKASLTAPTDVDEPKFHKTDIPKVCPICGREAAALVETKYDTFTQGKVSQSADTCVVSAENRGEWYGLSRETTFVHGTE